MYLYECCSYIFIKNNLRKVHELNISKEQKNHFANNNVGMFIFLFFVYFTIKLHKFIFKYITVECHHAFQHAAALLYAINTRADCLMECP